MFSLLVKINIQRFLSVLTKNRRSGKKGGLGSLLLLPVVVVFLMYSLSNVFGEIVEPMLMMETASLYFAMVGMSALALAFVGSVFMTYSQIFNSLDNDMLLSMPIKPTVILLSRLISIFIITFVYTAVVAIPALIAWFEFVPFDLMTVVMALVGLVLISALSMALTCFGAWLVSLLATKFRYKNAMTSIVLLGVFSAYMYFSMNITQYMQRLIEQGVQIEEAMRQSLPFMYGFGTAVGDGDFMGLATLALWSVPPLLVAFLLLSRSFVKIATTRTAAPKVKYKGGPMKQSGAKMAMLKKELSRFFKTPTYLFNCGIGALMNIVFPILIGSTLFDQLGELTPERTEALYSLIVPGMCAMFCLMSAANCSTSVSISLEGKSMPILRSMPISPGEVFFGKVALNMLLGAFGIIGGTIATAIFFGIANPLDLLMISLIPLIVQFFFALFGLIVNLKMPNFDWVSEAALVKRSGSVILCVFGGMAIVAVPAVFYFFYLNNNWGTMPATTYLMICGGIFALLSLLELLWLKTKGAKIYSSL